MPPPPNLSAASAASACCPAGPPGPRSVRAPEGTRTHSSIREIPKAEPPASDERLFTRSYVAMLCVQPFFGFAYSSFLLLPKYLTLQGAGPELIGRVAAMATFASAFAGLASGRLVLRVGLRRAYVLGAFLEGCCGFSYLLDLGTGPLLFAVRAIQGVAYAFALNASMTLVADAVPSAKLGQAFGLMGVAGLSMNALAPALAEPLARAKGWPWVFALAGVASWCAVLVALAGIRERPTRRGGAQDDAASPIVHPKDIYLASALIGVGLGAMFNFTQPFALRLGMRDVSGLFVGYTAAAVFVRTVFGNLPDRVGRRLVGTIAMVLYGVTVLSTAALRPGWLVPLGAMLGFAHGMIYPALGALAVQDARRAHRPMIMAIFSGGFNAGIGVGQLAFGPVAERLGFPPAFVMSGVIILLGVPWLARGGRGASSGIRSEQRVPAAPVVGGSSGR